MQESKHQNLTIPLSLILVDLSLIVASALTHHPLAHLAKAALVAVFLVLEVAPAFPNLASLATAALALAALSFSILFFLAADMSFPAGMAVCCSGLVRRA